MLTDIESNLRRVEERIGRACRRAGRRVEDISIVGVTKTHGPEVVEALVKAGVGDVGENRIQEFLDKKSAVTVRCRWHLVGTLQRNKAAKAVGQFELIHSVDRFKLASTLSRIGEEGAITSRILLEVNTSGESTKHGFQPEEIVEAAAAIDKLPGLELEGLMTVGPLTDDVTAIRHSFQSLAALREGIESNIGRRLAHLSMGMSDDFEIAIEEGATIVRLGRVLLGARPMGPPPRSTG